MKAVYIHGLGSDSEDELLRAVGERIPLEPVFVDYSYLYEREGWPEEVLSAVKGQLPPEEHVMISHSLGGPISAFLQNKETKALVFIAPAFSVSLGIRFTLLAEAARKGHAYFESKKGVWISKRDMNTLFNLMHRAPAATVPFAIIVGEEDMIVDNRASRAYFHRSNEKKSWLVEMAGTGHLFVGREREVAEIVRAFLRSLGLI